MIICGAKAEMIAVICFSVICFSVYNTCQTSAFMCLINFRHTLHPSQVNTTFASLSAPCCVINEGRKEMFYLMIYSTHFYLYGIGHMVKDHSESERGKLLLPLHGYSI